MADTAEPAPSAVPAPAADGDSAPRADWQVAALRAELSDVLPDASIEVVASVGSTSSVLLERARRAPGRVDDDRSGDDDDDEVPARVRRSVESRAFGDPAEARPCLLVAERQTEGRGRQGRSWRSAAGASLTFSLALPLAPRDWSGLSLAVGVALADALDPLLGPAGPRIGLKWPNDLWLLDEPPGGAGGRPPPPIGRKLGGILIETVGAAGPRKTVVVGIGLNLADPGPVAGLSGGVAALRELAPDLDGPAALRRVLRPLAEALRRFEREGFASFAAAWARRDLLRDRPLRTTSPAAPEGIGRGVEPDGALRVQTPDGRVARVSSGEVSVRPAPGATDGGA